MKTVCIVGAGPAGLVAAKTFLQTGQFQVSVYEKNKRLGGIWALDENTVNGFLNPQTPTNLSRFTVAFSDLDWRSVNLDSKHGSDIHNGTTGSGNPPMFPKAWHVNRYLMAYRRKFISEDVLHYGCEVVKAVRARQFTQSETKTFWRITIKDEGSQTEVKEFDYLIVASGFFSRPRNLWQDVPDYSDSDPSTSLRPQCVHSCHFKSLRDLFRDESSSISPATPMSYMFTTKTGTHLSTFKNFIKTLPDEGEGCQVIHEYVPWQSYVTNLTLAQANGVASQAFINFVTPITEHDVSGFAGPKRKKRKDSRNVLLIGGGNSSGEAAAAIAMQMSNAQWMPDTARQHVYKDCKVIHVLPRSLYPLPPFNEYESDSRTYVPIDFKLYDLQKRPPGPIESYAGQQTPAVRSMVHDALQKMVGGDQSDLGSGALVSPKDDSKGTVYVALSESYAEYVRSGLIDATRGRVTGIAHHADSGLIATVRVGDEETRIQDIGAIVYATGYTPSAALDFLAPDIKKALDFDPDSMRMPLILEQWQSIGAAVPEVAFLGFYEGPYWPMIEMQARMVAEHWLNGTIAPRRPFEDRDKLLQLRESMKAKATEVPQYWFGDYLGYMEDAAKHLKLDRNDGAFKEREGCPSPARYLSEISGREENTAIMQDLYRTWRECVEEGKYVARAAFRAMQGNWNISRRMVSQDQNFSGTLEGEASFHPRFPTADKSGQIFDLEYLYVESGTFTSASGMEMQASRRYVYRYSEAKDELSVWFVNDLEVDYLFHSLAFVPPTEARQAGALIAKADHLCVKDMYWTQYTLPIKGVALRAFEIKHTVKGPNKDYVATTSLTRPPKAAI